MSKRLYEELNRQLLRLESVKNKDFTDVSSAGRERDARTLERLERTHDRLMHKAEARNTRKQNAGRNDAEIRITLERRFARIAAGGPAHIVSEESES